MTKKKISTEKTGFHPNDLTRYTPYRPRALKIANAIIYLWDQLFGRALTLDADKLAEKACRKTGLSDFGDETFREPLRIICEITRNGSPMSIWGRFYCAQDISQRLINLLQIQADIKANPEILKSEVRRPIFILGLYRTGTTLLHRLLSQDTTNRTLQSWEMMMPSPPPNKTTYEIDHRIKKCRRLFSIVDYSAPAFRAIHEVDETTPHECIQLMANYLVGNTHDFLIGGEYSKWLYEKDLTSAYELHKRLLQYLWWKCPADRFVLKAPFHLHGLKWLLKTYPDARIVQTHRNPLEVVPSWASLMTVMRGSFYDNTDPVVIGPEVANRASEYINQGMEARSAQEQNENNTAIFLDIHYKKIVKDPIGTVEKIYNGFGLSLSDEAAARMRRYLDENPQHKYGAHRYTIEQFGLNENTERERFSTYCEHFGIT